MALISFKPFVARDTNCLRRSRIFHTESFGLAASFALLFLALAVTLMAAVYWIVNDTQTRALLDAIDADISTVNNGYREKGLHEAVEVVQQRVGSDTPARDMGASGYLLLQDPKGVKLAGNLNTMQPRLGIFSQRALRGHDELLGKGVQLDDGSFLFVGRDTHIIHVTRIRLLGSIARVTAAAIFLAVLGGVLSSVRFIKRIDAITKTCGSIMAGRLDERVAVRGTGSELDLVGVAINGMLDRITVLMENLRQVSSDVAHDLRTPLTHLRQRLENARAQARDMGEYSAAVARAIGDTDEILAVFSSLLRISQVEAGTRRSSFTELSLSELLDRIYEIYRPVAEDSGHVLSCDIAPGVRIRGDAELLLQLFINVVENALRHTSAGTRIHIALSASQGAALATVCDTGSGVPENEREKIFRRFYRLSASRTTPGNGLGLALVGAIAQLHGIKIDLSDHRPGLCLSLTIHTAEDNLAQT